MKLCKNCLSAFYGSVERQVYCCPECRIAATKEKQAGLRRKSPSKRKKCASNKCDNFVSEYTDSIYCSHCFLSGKVIEKDLRKIRRIVNA